MCQNQFITYPKISLLLRCFFHAIWKFTLMAGSLNSSAHYGSCFHGNSRCSDITIFCTLFVIRFPYNSMGTNGRTFRSVSVLQQAVFIMSVRLYFITRALLEVPSRGDIFTTVFTVESILFFYSNYASTSLLFINKNV